MCLDGNMPKSGRIDVGDLEANLSSVMMVRPAWRAAASNRRAEFARRKPPWNGHFLPVRRFFGTAAARQVFEQKGKFALHRLPKRIVYPIEFAERAMEWALLGLGLASS
jgi:hypothetical protein